MILDDARKEKKGKETQETGETGKRKKEKKRLELAWVQLNATWTSCNSTALGVVFTLAVRVTLIYAPG